MRYQKNMIRDVSDNFVHHNILSMINAYDC